MTLDELLDRYRQLMYLPDPTAVLAALGTIAADLLPGDPVWTLLVGPPSSGKTEIIDSLRHIPGAVSLSTVTKASLLSGRSGGAGGLLLTHFGDGTGTMLVKDLTTILSEAAGARTEVLAMLREIFDGHVTRAVGTRDAPLSWAGKLTFLGAVTEEIELHRAVIGLMGDRFVYIPIPSAPQHRAAITRQALLNGGHQRVQRDDLARTVATFIAGLQPPRQGAALAERDVEWLCDAANLASHARSPVIRDTRLREIDLVPEPEIPARLVGEFGQLWRGLTLIGASHDQARYVIQAAVLGSIPKQRRTVLIALLEHPGASTTLQVAARTRTPVSTVQRALEDLAALGLTNSDQQSWSSGTASTWTPNDTTRALWAGMNSSTHGTGPKAQRGRR